MKKVFLEHLPKKKNGYVEWDKCIGQKVHFIYNNIEGDIVTGKQIGRAHV